MSCVRIFIMKYYKTIEVICRVIIQRNKDILLCKNIEHSLYYLPGGHVEFGDSMNKTVYKELNEELGLREDQIKNLKYIDVLENFFGEGENQSHEINLIFSANLSEDASIKSMESHIDFEWKNINELKDISFMPIEMIPIIQNNI